MSRRGHQAPRRPHLFLCWVVLGAPATVTVTGCAMKGASHGSRQYRAESADSAGSPTPAPRSIAEWERELQRHTVALGHLTSPEPPPPPAAPGPGTVSPGTTSKLSGTRPLRRAAPKQSFRCRRICQHVRAICYAASRICQLADRVMDPPSRHACSRGRQRCRLARTTARRQACPDCGQRAGRSQRRACYGWLVF